MPNEILKVVKRHRTANKYKERNADVTIFKKITYGYHQDGKVSFSIIQNIDYEIFKGAFYNYQLALRENQKVERL